MVPAVLWFSLSAKLQSLLESHTPENPQKVIGRVHASMVHEDWPLTVLNHNKNHQAKKSRPWISLSWISVLYNPQVWMRGHASSLQTWSNESKKLGWRECPGTHRIWAMKNHHYQQQQRRRRRRPPVCLGIENSHPPKELTKPTKVNCSCNICATSRVPAAPKLMALEPKALKSCCWRLQKKRHRGS